jgi:uncharacterized NAD-dependent epimerase/dehydratase family protein
MLTPGRIYPGTELRLNVSFYDTDGVLVDPTTVTFKVRCEATGQITTYVYGTDAEVGKTSTGLYYADTTPDRGGRWSIRWETTGTGTTFTVEDDFVVRASPFVDATYRDYA